jgi:arsenate reductase
MNILILCTGNSARSILGEVLISAQPGLKGFSAGSQPKGQPHPMALAVLSNHGHDITGLRSKSWDEFGTPGAPAMDAIITVCDSAAAETCPYWPGHPVQAHWGLPDPAAVIGDGQRAAFEATYGALKARIEHLTALPLSQLAGNELRAAIQCVHTAL